MKTSRTASRTGRRPGPTGETKAQILDAARTLFGEGGFRGTTTRQIAARAGVDVALIHHFFGTKADLFEAAIQLPRIAGEAFAKLTAPGVNLGETIARLYLQEIFVRESATFSAMLRTAVGDPHDIPHLRRMVEQTAVGVLAEALGGGPDAALRAELVAAQMVGLLVVRQLVGIEPIASTSVEELVRRLAPALNAIIESAAPAMQSEG